METGEKIDFLAGEVSALRAFALAVINSHPNLRLLRDEFERLSELQIGLSVPSTVTEQYLDGQRQAADVLRAHIAARINEGA
jgi:hypothetical protein